MKQYFALLCLAAAVASEARDTVKVLNNDAQYPEGPVWYDNKLYYIEYARNTVTVWDGKRNTVFSSLKGCGPSAVIPTTQGEFLVACADDNSIKRINSAGAPVASYTHDQSGNDFISPNDFAPDTYGGIYFTASGNHSSFADASRSADAPIIEGKVFYIAANGIITQKEVDLHSANGIAVSKDRKTLYVAETDEHLLIEFTITTNGGLSDRRVFVNLDDLTHNVMHVWPDGLKIDSHGAIYIGQSAQEKNSPFAGAILVVDENAKLLRTLVFPSLQVPNLAFSPDEATVYATGVDQIDHAPYHGKLYSISNSLAKETEH